MEGIGFRTLLPGLDSHGLNRRLWHFGNGLGAVVHGVAARRRAGREREGWASACDGALGARPKLLGPVETLLVISGAAAGASGSHAGGTKAHSPDKGRVGRGSSGARPHFIVLNGALINRIRCVGVGGQAAPTNVEGLSTAGGSAREAERGDGEPSAVDINRVGLSGETRAGWD